MNDNVVRAILAGYDESYSWGYWSAGEEINIDAYTITCVDAYIPVEDSGRPAELVFKMVSNEYPYDVFAYYKKTAYYDSYSGVRWDTGTFGRVKPVEKVVYDYE